MGKASEDLESLRREVVRLRTLTEDVIAVVSHDLRNPLSVVSMNAHYLLRTLPEDERGLHVRKRVDVIRRSAERIERLIRDLSDVANIEAGRLRVELEPQDLHELVTEAVEPFRPAAAESSIVLEVQLPGGPLRVLCDRERMVQVLSSLLGNALKFTKQGRVRVVAEEGPGRVRISVVDTGTGIAAGDLEHLFSRHRPAGPGRAGVGLGLFIAKALVEAHGGDLVVRSEVGVGTELSFTLASAPSSP